MWPLSKKHVEAPPAGKVNSEGSILDDQESTTLGLGKYGLIFACGSALFSDGYVNAVIGPVNTILGVLYAEEMANTNYSQLLSSMAFAGTVIGMLVFGVISDRIGRKAGMLVATVIIFVFTALTAGAKGAGGSVPGMLKALIAYRFLTGIGIGAEYPSGSVAASENSEAKGVPKMRRQMMFQLATSSMIDLGFVIAAFVPLVLLWICGMNHLRAVWRISVGLGVVPPLLLLYFRVKMREPEQYRMHNMRKCKVPWMLIIRRYWVKIAAVSLNWFIYDWIVYPFGLYSSVIISVADSESTLYTSLGWGCLVNAFYLPGTFLGAIFVSDRLGPRNTMIFGLLAQAIFGFVLSGAYNALTKHENIAAFAVLYGLFLSFGELGPGNNLGLLASKAIGPTAVRGTLYGVAAAVGKVGAFAGSYCFKPIIADLGGSGTYAGATGPFYIASALAIFSAGITYFFIPNIDADYMERDNIEFKAYLEANGWDTSAMGEIIALDPESAGQMQKS
ncbi:Inorganic phosphate transporter [Phaffia rhodozyma]|uniref:Inorganic phosphate transporter n=1 Tax=Phaffia rhodozyma TaxID=264483 RepID=A0A0F7SNU4_PHARH|nr:Inorganic phosphate transporter [Phaffia rhodozyma]